MAKLPDDLKRYRPSEDGFQLLDADTAGYLIFAAVLIAMILERLGVL